MKDRIKNKLNLFKLIFDNNYNENFHARYTGIISAIFTVISFILSIMNFVHHYSFMGIMTSVLCAGFAISTVFALKNKHKVSYLIIVVLCIVVFSTFAVTGGNNGFAILWILLIPILSYMLIGLKFGFFLNAYFQIFLLVLMYTPLSTYIKSYYTPIFIVRFPILYFAAFVSVTVLYCEHQKLYNTVHKQAYYDAMTDLYNRRKFDETIEELETENRKVSVISLDINKLKYANDNFGHHAGDELIKSAASLIKQSFGRDLCFRIGGDEFIVISFRKMNDIKQSISDFNASVKQWKGTLNDSLSISLGSGFSEENPNIHIDKLCNLADQKMYENKKNFYGNTDYLGK